MQEVLAEVFRRGELLDCSKSAQDLNRRSEPNHAQAARERETGHDRQFPRGFLPFPIENHQRITDLKLLRAPRAPVILEGQKPRAGFTVVPSGSDGITGGPQGPLEVQQILVTPGASR